MSDLDRVETIVLVMMENRSFDHLLGWMSLAAYGGRGDVDGLVGALDPATREVTNPQYDNYALGHRWRPLVASADVPLVTDVPHGRAQVADQLDLSPVIGGFGMAGFARSYFAAYPGNRGAPPESLLVFPPQLLPTTSFLARTYTVCDRWFCPLPADTQPNRFMALAGYSRVDVTNPNPPDHEILLDWCSARNVRWRVYHEGFSFITLFRRSVLLDPRFVSFDELAKDFQTEGDDTFPQVILVEPAYDDDPFASHPDDNHPPLPMGPGEIFLSRVYKAVTSNPARWARTVLVVCYDEHGGFFDHVPPLPIRAEDPAGRYPAFETTGPRVPAIVVSPFARPGAVCHQELDHTSVLRFLGERFSSDGKYSDAVTARHASSGLGSLAAALDLAAPGVREPPPPPALGPVLAIAHGEPRTPVTPMQHAFARARAEAHAEVADAVAERHPQMLFEMPHPLAAASGVAPGVRPPAADGAGGGRRAGGTRAASRRTGRAAGARRKPARRR